MDIYKKFETLGIKIVPGPKPLGRYHTAIQSSGPLLFSAGTGCRIGEKPLFTGKVGSDVTLEEAQLCARQCVLNLLCNLQNQLQDLNRVERVIKVLGFVASSDDFFYQSQVLNAASDLLYEIWGESGIGVRTAIGVRCLPGNIPVEIEVIFQLRN